jgi:hypothetical protein
MLDNFVHARFGVRPGDYASVSRHEGDRVLAFVDTEAAAFANWPSGMATANVTQFARLLDSFLLSEDISPIRAVIERDDSQPFPGRTGESRAAKELFFKFEALVKDNLKNPKFRRADIERLVSQHLGSLLKFDRAARPFDPRIYNSVNELVRADRGRNVNLVACQYLLSTTSTLYEAYHASQYQTVGGLFSAHDADLIDAGVYGELLNLAKSTDIAAVRMPLAAGTFDVSALSVQDVIDIRKSDQFHNYVRKLKRMSIPLPSQSFRDANAALFEGALTVYLRYITSKYPKSGTIQAITKAVGTVGGTALPIIASLHTIGPINTVWLAERPMLVAICGAAARVTGSYAGELAEFFARWRRRRTNRRHRKNNYVGLK